jgi:two-component sensor histidine kinase
MIRTIVLSFSFLLCYSLNAAAQDIIGAEIKENKLALKRSRADSGKVNLLLKLSELYIIKVGEAAKDLDSSIGFTNEAAALSQRLSYNKGTCQSYLQYAMAYREKGEREKGKQYANEAIDLSERYQQYSLLGDSYIELSQYYNFWDSAEALIKIGITQKAYDAYTKTANIEKQAFALKNLADLHLQTKNGSQAFLELLHVLALYKSIGYQRLQGVYDLLGSYYSDLSDFSNGIKYGLLALQSAAIVKDSTAQVGTLHNRLGISYFNAKNYQLAVPQFIKAVEILQKFHDPVRYIVASNVVNSYLNLNKPKDALSFLIQRVKPDTAKSEGDQLTVNGMFLLTYTAMGNYAAAKTYCDLLVKTEGAKHNMNILKGIIRYYTATKQFSKAAEYLGYHNQELVNDYRATTILMNRFLWFQLDSSRGNYLSAIGYLRDYSLMQDSLYNVSKSKIIEATQIEYETAKKDQDIQLKAQSIELLQKQSQLQQNNLQRSRIFVYAISIGLVLVLVILALLYYQYRQKNKANQNISQKNDALQQLVNEKEWLLKEVHHRVKNNLQTIVSLLESQSAYLDDRALEAIQESQNRVNAMSLIHQRLYQSDKVASIDMAAYLPELIQYLKDNYTVKQRIRFQVQIQSLEIDVSQAIPVGLILNEAITNSIKHAFPKERTGNDIVISMIQVNKLVELTIADNGVGLPHDLNYQAAGGLGLRLMKGLTGDIEGQFNITSNNGTIITISFLPKSPLDKNQ